ncbi:MAG: hypothetical protein IRY99_07625 [Isosphaeraceae bacterium]|nr:hypothetical protein [Isosphaeraceae bacterium]
MWDQYYVYAVAALIIGVFLTHVVRKTFDPFAPIWLFLVGYTQVYIIQAISYRDWALRVRGIDLVTAAGARSLWALAWFVVVYHSGLGRVLAARLPRPPATWSAPLVFAISPVMIAWGLISAGLLFRYGLLSDDPTRYSAEETLLRQFPLLMLAAGVLLIVTGRLLGRPPIFWAGVATAAAYALIWTFNGKRSHSLLGVLTGVCAFYITKQRRPSWPVLLTTAVTGAMIVGLAIGWRGNNNYEHSLSGFLQYISEFDPSRVLESLNLKTRGEEGEMVTYETEEYGGYLLMLDTVPEEADYDYGANYIRIVSTFIPRLIWPSKPVFGREKWVNAWIAGSELPRDANFEGPAIGILGAAQLNGGVVGTFLVLAVVALFWRTAYEYFRLYALVPWVQAWWALTFYNSWFTVVCDDPANWFYYTYGQASFPPLLFLWCANRLAGRTTAVPWPVPIG